MKDTRTRAQYSGTRIAARSSLTLDGTGLRLVLLIDTRGSEKSQYANHITRALCRR